MANWWAAFAADAIAGIVVGSIETTVEAVTTKNVDVYLGTRTVYIWVSIMDDIFKKKRKREVQERRARAVTTATKR
ncbi:hypothetical protein [Streptosporangium canum]|uniref:hypothetical protein n=1 Tax=Streptosporangium canum TaxID=324952 RepID=UPI00343E085B